MPPRSSRANALRALALGAAALVASAGAAVVPLRALGLAALVSSAGAAAAAAAAPAAPAAPAPRFRFLILREDCVDTFFVRHDFFNASCLAAAVSKTLGYGIIAGSCLVKAPQLAAMLAARSGEGVSRESTYLELLSSLLSVVWHTWNGSPFSAFGESAIVGAGSAAVVAALWAYDPPTLGHAAGWAALALGTGALGLVSPGALARAAGAPGGAPAALAAVAFAGTAIFAASRVTQIAAVAAAGGTGTLSGLTLAMNAAGTLARVFTSANEVGDALQLATTALCAALNLALLAQWAYYALRGAPAAAKATARAGRPRRATAKYA